MAAELDDIIHQPVTATAAGRGAFARHVASLQELIAASSRDN